MSTDTATLTIAPDLRKLRAVLAYGAGMPDLADVIMTQPGRQIVRDGMDDVLHWLNECDCSPLTHCSYIERRRQETAEAIAKAIGAAAAAVAQHINKIAEQMKPIAEHLNRMAKDDLAKDDFALAPPPHRAGRAAQRSTYGPQGRR